MNVWCGCALLRASIWGSPQKDGRNVWTYGPENKMQRNRVLLGLSGRYVAQNEALDEIYNLEWIRMPKLFEKQAV